MKITTLVLNAEGEPHFQSEDHINLDTLFELAKTREQTCLAQGADWTASAVPFFGGEVVKAVDFGEHDDVTKAIFQMLIATWLFDSLYCGITASRYRDADMKFTIAQNGVVAHTFVPKLGLNV